MAWRGWYWGVGVRPAPVAAQQREAAQGDAGDDGRPAGDLRRADRVSEEEGACHGPDEGFEVEESPGQFGGYPTLPVGKEGEREQGAPGCQASGREDSARAGGSGGHSFGGHGERQRSESGAEELHSGDRHGVTVAQQAALGHGDGGRQQQGGQHDGVAASGRATSPATGDEAGTRE